MATESVAAGTCSCKLKEWLRKVNSVEEFIEFIDYLNSIMTGVSIESVERSKDFSIAKETVVSMLHTPFLHKQFCKEVFNICSKEVAITSKLLIPWSKFFQVLYLADVDLNLINLVELLMKERHTKVQMKIADCLQYMLRNNFMVKLLWKQCLVRPVTITNEKPIFSPSYQMHAELLLKLIIHLPDHIANKLHLKASSIFEPSTYFKILSTSVSEVLTQIHRSIQESQDCSLVFVSQLFAKICSMGKSDVLYEVLLPKITEWVSLSPLWCRICSKLILSCPDNYLESCIEPLLKKCESTDIVCSLLGEAILSKPKLQFLLTHKFLFVRTYGNDKVPLHIISYLSQKESRESYFKKTLLTLLDVWGDRSTIKHTSYEHHLYISKCLLISLSCMNQQQKSAWKKEMILKLMNGMTSHLECPDKKVHTLGMVVGECLTSMVDKNGKKLNFDTERTKEIEYLYQLASNPSATISFKCEDEAHKKNDHEKNDAEGKKENETKIDDEELDSDDDLEPLNIEEDENVNGVKPPVYLRDCLAGLLSSNDPGRLEACLKVLEKLVKREPGDLSDVCVEIIKIMLHLENQYNIQNFHEIKTKAVIAITVRCPKKISEYLATQFHEENYSINQRLDILETIAKAATELSNPTIDDPDVHRPHLPLPNTPGLTLQENKPDWQVIVDERVKKKTRRFGKSCTKQLQSPTENKFADVAGSFFFPFIKNFDMRLNTCNMLGDDCVVLGKFIYTLGVVLQAADGLTIAAVMGKALLDVVWALRYHKEAFVRQSLMYAVIMIVLHVPSFTLMTELQDDILEARDWLAEVIKEDPNSECRRLGASCLLLLEKVMKEELLGGAED